MTTDASEDWQRWHEGRVATVSAPYGPLALIGTHWLEDYPDGRLPDNPGSWRADGDTVVLTAAEADGLTVDGQPFGGEVRLAADPGPANGARVAYGERRLVVLVREGAWGVRDFDPESTARRAFRGLRVTPYDPRWAVPGRVHAVRHRPYGPGAERRRARARARARRGTGLRAGRAGAEAEGGASGRRLAVVRLRRRHQRERQLPLPVPAPRPAAPDAEGRTTVDFNRALLPPCAFANHFVCPFRPPGNTLDVEVAAGERTLV